MSLPPDEQTLVKNVVRGVPFEPLTWTREPGLPDFRTEPITGAQLAALIEMDHRKRQRANVRGIIMLIIVGLVLLWLLTLAVRHA